MNAGADTPPDALLACVDDDAQVREALEGLLKAFGFAVETFASAEDLLQSEPLARFSCLIVDVRMSGMSGIELLRRLAAAGHRIPAIVITAFGDQGLRAQALAAGAVHLLHKPIRREDLLSAIEAALTA